MARSLIVELTERCNANCLYCYNTWKLHPSGRKELSTFWLKRLLKKAVRQSNAEVVTLTGGEPLLRPDVEKLAKFLGKFHVSVNLITNGTFIDKKRAKSLVESGISVFELPLLSGKREVHNSLMRADSFDLVTEAIVNLKKEGGKVVAVFIATKKNITDFTDMAKIAFALSVDGIMLNRFNAGGEGAKNLPELMPDAAGLKKLFDEAEVVSKEYKLQISSSIPVPPCILDTSGYKNLSFGYCAAGTDQAYYTIGIRGDIRMCNHSNLVLGNLFKEDFEAIVSKQKARDFIAAVPDGCFECGIKAKCKGGCKAAGEECYGSLTKDDPFVKLNEKVKKVIKNS